MSSSTASLLRVHNAFFERLIHVLPPDLYRRRYEDNEDAAAAAAGADTDTDADAEADKDIEDDLAIEESTSKYQKHRQNPLTADKKKLLSRKARALKFRSLENASALVDVDGDGDNVDGEDESVTNKHALDALRDRLQVRLRGCIVLIDVPLIYSLNFTTAKDP